MLRGLKALFHQPGGSAALRRLLTVGLVSACALSALVLGPWMGMPGTLANVLLGLTSVVAICAAPIVERRRKPLDATLDLLPGRVVVRDGAGRVRATIKARSIVGATTARLASSSEEVSLVLARKPAGSRPAVLRLADETAADEVRRCLGVGPGGFGVAQWPTGAAKEDAFRILFRLGWRLLLAWTVLEFVIAGSNATGLAFLAFCFGGMALAMRVTGDPAGIQLSGRGVAARARGLVAEVKIPYAAIGAVDVGPTGSIALDCAAPFGRIELAARARRGLRGLDAEEREHVVAQLRAAADRARQPAFHAEKASRLELLRRGEDTIAGWLARLDALGQSLKGARDYRAVALDEGELWNAVENPEVDRELRTAAARVLVHHAQPASEGEAQRRIESVLSAERDPGATRRIRVALEPDVELATHELEELEREGAVRRR